MLGECENYENCQLCKAVFESGAPAPWIIAYCKGGKMEECARYRHKSDKGTPPPLDLLPDGTTAHGRLKQVLDAHEGAWHK